MKEQKHKWTPQEDDARNELASFSLVIMKLGAFDFRIKASIFKDTDCEALTDCANKLDECGNELYKLGKKVGDIYETLYKIKYGKGM